jgi:DNA-binding MarR family transcriptional regulator
MAARALTRHFGAYFRPLGLTTAQFGVLVTLAGRPALQVRGLAEAIGIDATTMVRGIQQLERRGLVESTGGSGRQSKKSSLTKRGLRLLERAIPQWEAAYEAIAQEMGSAAMKQAVATMAKLEEAAARARR